MKNFLATIFIFLCVYGVSWAKHMAVLETLSPKELLTLQERQFLTDVLRSQAVRVLPAEQNWTIMTRENINVMLPPGKTIEECEGSCLAETGRNIAADYVAQARISQFGSSYAISVELYETAGNKLVSSFNGRGESLDDIEKIIKEQAPGFFKKARGSSWGDAGFGDFSSTDDFSYSGIKRFWVQIETNPAGAIPTVDGKAYPKCTSTPCAVQLEKGEHRFVVSRERFDDKDTIVNVTIDSQKVSLSLIPNVGYVDLRPSIQEKFKKYPLKVVIDGKPGKAGKTELVPGVHEVRIAHYCYNPVSFKVAVKKGKVETFTDSLVRGIGGLELETVRSNKVESVPVFFDGAKVGSTPYSGEVPMCAQIEVGDSREEVNVQLKWHDVVHKVHELKPVQAGVYEDSVRKRADDAYAELDGQKSEQNKSVIAEKDSPQKWIWGGAFIAGTYNDVYGSSFGLDNLDSENGYTLEVVGADGLAGNFWGLGFNAGVSGLFLFNTHFAVRTDVGVAFRRGSGKSDMTVKLYWDDESKQPEKSDLELDYDMLQLNIDVPIAFRLIFPAMVYFEAGPMVSFNLYSNTECEVTDIYGTESFDSSGDFNVFELDMFAGIGVMRYVGKSILDFNLRLVMGLTPLNDANDSPKTWQGQFSVGYWFI